MTKLMFSETQTNRRGQDESTLFLSVRYDEREGTVDKILEARVYNHKEKVTTDITRILADRFFDQFESMIDSINWSEVYAEQMEEERRYEAERRMEA